MLLTRYILRQLLWPLCLLCIGFTGMIWLMQALRFIDFIINRGLDLADFLGLTILLVPALLYYIFPIALVVACSFTYYKLLQENELVVMRSSGMSSGALLRPALWIGIMAMLLSLLLSFFIMPAAKRQFKDMQIFLRDNYAASLLQEEVFNSPINGLTVYIRERDSTGQLRGIIVHDNRITDAPLTLLAEQATIEQSTRGLVFLMTNGMRQQAQKTSQADSTPRISWLKFDSYSLDLNFYNNKTMERKYEEGELYPGELIQRIHSAENPASLKSEWHMRLIWPCYALLMPLLAVAFLLHLPFSRRGQLKSLLVLASMYVALIPAILALGSIAGRHILLELSSYALMLSVAGASWWLIKRSNNLNAPANTHHKSMMEVAS